MLIGALDEAAMYIATAEDRAAARAEVAKVLHGLLDGLVSGVGTAEGAEPPH